MKKIVALINIDYQQNVVIDNLGLGSIASFLRMKAVEVDLINLPKEVIGSDLNGFNFNGYDIIGFSLFAENADLVYETATYLKQKHQSVLIVVGGHLATDAYNFILKDCSAIDCVVLGDGEKPLLDIVNSFRMHGSVDGLASVVTRTDTSLKHPAIIDIMDIDWPARDNLVASFHNNNVSARITSSRGCCGSCSFCSVGTGYRKQWVGRNMTDVFLEITSLYELYGIRCFMFNDGSFEDPGDLGKERIRQLCDLLLEYPTRFSFHCFLKAESFSQIDINLIRLMKSAGFIQVFIGFESQNQADLKLYHKRATTEDNIRANRLFTENGIRVVVGFIMLNPFSTEETLMLNYEFLSEIHSYYIRDYICKLAVYYNTRIYHELEAQHLLGDDYSYRTPEKYKFVNPLCETISIFINEFFETTDFCDEEYIANVSLMDSLFLLYPEEMEPYFQRYNVLLDSIAQVLSKYFRILYIDHDMDLSKKTFEGFKGELIGLHKRVKNLTLRAISNPVIMDFVTAPQQSLDIVPLLQ